MHLILTILYSSKILCTKIHSTITQLLDSLRLSSATLTVSGQIPLDQVNRRSVRVACGHHAAGRHRRQDPAHLGGYVAVAAARGRGALGQLHEGLDKVTERGRQSICRSSG